MHRFQVSLRRMLIVVVPIAAAFAMAARAAMSWGPMNLVVLVGFVLVAAAILACVPIIPNRPFWKGLAGFGFLYVAMLWLLMTSSGIGLEFNPIYRGLAESRYGPTPNLAASCLSPDPREEYEFAIHGFVAATHAITALAFGIFGGCALLILARARESRRWARDAPPELPLEDFMLPPLKVDRPLDSK